MSEEVHDGLALWRSLLADLPASRQDTLAGWFQGGPQGWQVEAIQSMATWPAPERAVAAVLLYRNFKETSRHTSRIISEAVMDQAPLPAELLPALPWGLMECEAAMAFDFSVRDILRVLVLWSADPTAAALAHCSSDLPSRGQLIAWLGRQPARPDILAALASGLADKSRPLTRRCMSALVSHGTVAAPPVIAMLSARSTATRRLAAETLGQIGAPEALAALREARAVERSAKTRAAMDGAIQACSG